jgi:radical SAM enzyme (TIGR01210 family)
MDATSRPTDGRVRQERYLRSCVERLLQFGRSGYARVADPLPRWRAVDDSRGQRLIIGAASRGCSYARSAFGGCSNCGHVASTLWNRRMTDEELFGSFEETLRDISSPTPETLCIFTSGSFLDDSELSSELRLRILKAACERLRPARLIIESLPGFVTPHKLNAIQRCISAAELIVSMGMDAGSDLTRYLCVAKDFTDGQYEVATAYCRAAGASAAIYVSLGLPFLTRGEAIEDAVAGLHKAVSFGASAVSLEPIALQEATLQKLLFVTGCYRPPTIWSIVQTLNTWRQRYPLDRATIHVGGTVFTPVPFRVFAACATCHRNAVSSAEDGFVQAIISGIATTAEAGEDCCADERRGLTGVATLSQLEARIGEASTVVFGSPSAALWSSQLHSS